jgi:hypothetical protein
MASIPKMRTASGIVAEIRKDDPDTAVTEYHVRMLFKSGKVHVVKSGRKALANVDDVIALLAGRTG